MRERERETCIGILCVCASIYTPSRFGLAMERALSCGAFFVVAITAWGGRNGEVETKEGNDLMRF